MYALDYKILRFQILINYTSMSHEVLIYLMNAHIPAVHCTS